MSAMDQRQLIEEIRQFNPTATAEFLQQFEDEALEQYLEHLQAAKERRDGFAARVFPWVGAAAAADGVLRRATSDPYHPVKTRDRRSAEVSSAMRRSGHFPPAPPDRQSSGGRPSGAIIRVS